MSKKLFVGSMSWNTTPDSLRAAFAQFGDIEDAVVISDRETGRSRGFGFVTFADDAAADAAMQSLNGSMLDGRTINVNEATERAPRRGGGGGGGGGYRGGGGGGGGDRGGDRGGRGGDRGGRGDRGDRGGGGDRW